MFSSILVHFFWIHPYSKTMVFMKTDLYNFLLPDSSSNFLKQIIVEIKRSAKIARGKESGGGKEETSRRTKYECRKAHTV